MKQLLSNLIGSTVDSTEGPSGKVLDFYFDDHHWILRYLVCELPKEEGKRSVLIPSGHFRPKDWDLPVFPVALDHDQVHTCPGIDTDMPVSRQKTAGSGVIIPWPEMGGMGSPAFLINYSSPSPKDGDPHLRSFDVVRHYLVESSRGVIGKVKDFVVDDNGWSIHGLIIKLGPWFRTKTTMVTPYWAKEIDWANGTIWTDVHPIDWQTAPPFTVRRRPAPLL